MTLRFDRNSVVAFGEPLPTGRRPAALRKLPTGDPFTIASGLRLFDVLSPLTVPAPTLAAQYDRRLSLERMRLLEARLRRSRLATNADDVERRLRYLDRERRPITDVFRNQAVRLPIAWQRWLSWTHRCYEQALPPELPVLLDAFEALVAVEPLLQVHPDRPNRDHVVHQLADAEVAVKLHAVAGAGFDTRDWRALKSSVRGLKPAQRGQITRCGLALAGMFHDIGYLRYIGSAARNALATSFGLAAPGPAFDLWEVMEDFGGTYLERILSPSGARADGLIADVFAFAWDNGWHGPLSARVLASTARRLRAETRSRPAVEAALQIATAVAFCHELHAVKTEQEAVPRAIGVARDRIAAFAWPVLFRIVDELQCWHRPTLTPCPAKDSERAELTYGAQGAELTSITGGTRRLALLDGGRPRKEGDALRYLHSRRPAVFKALGIQNERDIVSS